MDKNNQQNKIICYWCGVPTQIIWVHGHGQCAHCGINIDECCRGENCTDNKPIAQQDSPVSKNKLQNN